MLGIACLLSHFLSANVQCFVDAGLLWTSVRTLSMLGSSERCSMRYNFLMGVSKTLLLASRAIRPPKRLARQTWILSRPRERERESRSSSSSSSGGRSSSSSSGSGNGSSSRRRSSSSEVVAIVVVVVAACRRFGARLGYHVAHLAFQNLL